jgi:hypothetical protein
LNRLHQNVRDALVNFFNYVIRDRFWASFLITTQFEEDWRLINRVVAEIRREKNRLQEVKNSILCKWRDVATSELQNRSYHHLNQLRKMFMTMIYAKTKKLITRAIVYRLINKRRNRSIILMTQIEDLIKIMTSDLSVVSSEEELHQLKVQIKDEIVIYVAQRRILDEVQQTSRLKVKSIISRSFRITSRTFISNSVTTHRRIVSESTHMKTSDLFIFCQDIFQSTKQIFSDNELSNITKKDLMQLKKKVENRITNKCTCSDDVKMRWKREMNNTRA